MRITGLATGLDMDEIIKNSMKPYRVKVDQMTQKKDVVEIKQKLYRDIMSDASKFYDKYFDLTKSDSLLKSSNYKAVSFTSSSDSVKVTVGSGAKPGNYTVTGSAATAAKAVIKENVSNGNKIVINGKEFELKGDTTNDMEKALNNQLKQSGINVSATFSEVAGGPGKPALVLESTVLGKDSTFTVGGTSTSIGIENPGIDATSAKTTIDNSISGKININDIDIDLSGLTDNKSKIDELNKQLKDKNITASEEEGKIVLTSTKKGNDSEIKVNGLVVAKGTPGNPATNTGVNVSDIDKKRLSINGKIIDVSFSGITDKEAYLNDLLKDKGVDATAKIDDKGEITFTSTKDGTSGLVDIKVIKADSVNPIIVTAGNDSTIEIKDEKTGEVYKHTGKSNTVTLDGVTFTFNGKIDGETKITGKNDVTEIKDKLVNFINDYNTLMEKLNTLTMTRHDKGYDPLTADQKKEMSENEIKLWNERVEKGQLYKDTDLTRITDSLKSTMRTVMDGTGVNLQKIGITPVKDYTGTKNGTFTIDESKLTEALEEDIESVMNLFIGKPEEGDKTSSEYTSKTGILHQLNDTLKQEFKTSSSSLSKKVGMEGTSTFTNNELTKSMSNYEKKIKDMEKDFSRREQALYSKYATLEKMMNKLNSQQSNLMSQLGMS